MSKIEDLIAEMCPEGVRYSEIDECFFVKNGYTPSKANSAFWTNGTVPWFRMDDIRKNGRVLANSIQHVTESAVKKGVLFPADSIVMSTTATIGEHALVTTAFLANQQMTVFSLKSDRQHDLNIKFFFYLCYGLGEWCRSNVSGAGLAIISTAKIKKYRIPVPPIEVQREIVRVLDSFTELEAELEAELDARKKQYEFYRNQLLTFDDTRGSSWTTLGEVLDYEQPSKYIVKSTEYSNAYNTPVLTAGQSFVLGYTDESSGIYVASQDNPVIIFDDFTTGNHWVDFDFKVKSSAMKMLRPKQNTGINFRFVYHFIQTIKYEPQDHARQWISKYAQFNIPIPSLSEQDRIVSILDKFDKITTDISEGLPAELNARRKQYEHYRNKLLTFKELQNA